jgi:hypothetical protein
MGGAPTLQYGSDNSACARSISFGRPQARKIAANSSREGMKTGPDGKTSSTRVVIATACQTPEFRILKLAGSSTGTAPKAGRNTTSDRNRSLPPSTDLQPHGRRASRCLSHHQPRRHATPPQRFRISTNRPRPPSSPRPDRSGLRNLAAVRITPPPTPVRHAPPTPPPRAPAG